MKSSRSPIDLLRIRKKAVAIVICLCIIIGVIFGITILSIRLGACLMVKATDQVSYTTLLAMHFTVQATNYMQIETQTSADVSKRPVAQIQEQIEYAIKTQSQSKATIEENNSSKTTVQTAEENSTESITQVKEPTTVETGAQVEAENSTESISESNEPAKTKPHPVLTRAGGVNYFNGHKETWYSERVLPGGGLKIPGRHTDEAGLVRDGDGYICVASSDYPKGTVVETSLGIAKVYDCGCPHNVIDIYTNW